MANTVFEALAVTSPVPAIGGNHSVLSPSGIQASSIHHLWTLMFWVCAVVFAIVLTALSLAARRAISKKTDQLSSSTSDHVLARAVAFAVGTTVVVLLGLLGASVWTGRAISSLHASSALTIEIIGHQWWWEIRYDDASPDRRVVTANEFHVPTNRPVVLKVTSRDVIHSFWVPNLQGKRDLIPGYTTAVWIQADSPGVFHGQCAEFCGLQHAHMAIDVIAEPDADFERWLDAMRQPARDPSEGAARRGRDLFMQARCAGCHAVKGTEAAGEIAPDLTHLATRSTLGAGTLSNTHEHLADWILDPQRVKPGNQMPPNAFSPDDLDALVVFLESLR
jgi:cytochrome c oxidase subunit II